MFVQFLIPPSRFSSCISRHMSEIERSTMQSIERRLQSRISAGIGKFVFGWMAKTLLQSLN